MIPIKFLIRRIRHAIHDEQHVNYSDHEILDVINAGMRIYSSNDSKYSAGNFNE